MSKITNDGLTRWPGPAQNAL